MILLYINYLYTFISQFHCVKLPQIKRKKEISKYKISGLQEKISETKNTIHIYLILHLSPLKYKRWESF